MSQSTGGIFSRIKRAISGTVNEAIDEMSDPGKELGLMLDDLADQIQQAEADLKQATVDRKMIERKLAKLEEDEKAWAGRAEQALRADDENLARAALEKKNSIAQERATTKTNLVEQLKIIGDMSTHIEQSKSRLKNLNLRRGSLMAQARASKHGSTTAAGVGIAATSKLDEIEDKIAQLEALNEVDMETRQEEIQAAEVDAKLAALDDGHSSEIDNELEALKSKLREQKALPKDT